MDGPRLHFSAGGGDVIAILAGGNDKGGMRKLNIKRIKTQRDKNALERIKILIVQSKHTVHARFFFNKVLVYLSLCFQKMMCYSLNLWSGITPST